MKHRIFLFAIGSILLFTACQNEDTPNPSNNNTNNSRNKIMPLGASRVEGASSFESYRYELWKQLIDGGWEFDLIGTKDDPESYADYADQSFDRDHEGRGGWTSTLILQGINGWLRQTGPPDIVLFSSPGGNDALQGLSYDVALSNVNAIIDAIQAANPNVTIIIEQMAPGRSEIMTPGLTTFFEKVQQDVITVAEQQSTSTSKVLPVDMATDFIDAYLADDVHYNQAGAAFIATRYYEVLVGVLED